MHIVTGAAGFIGSHLVDALIERGLPVAACVHPDDDLRWLHGKPVELRPIDVTDPDTLVPALRDAEVIYHVAGMTGSASQRTLFDVNCEGTAHVARVAAEHAPGLRRFVHVSSTTVLGPSTRGKPRTERDAAHPVSSYGWSKHLAEVCVRQVPGLPWVIVRPAAVYGPRDAAFLTAFRLAQRHLYLQVGRGRREVSFVHVQDVVRCILLAADRGEVGHTYHASGETNDFRQARHALHWALGKQLLGVPLPGPVVWLVGELMEIRRKLTGRKHTINRRKAKELLEPGWASSGENTTEELGFRPTWGLLEGFWATAAWYREHGWLG